MYQLVIPDIERYDEINNEFITNRGQTIQVEHSLVSISKWESKWNKPFLIDDVKSRDETIDYIKCMTITKNVDPLVYENITNKNVRDIDNYIKLPMTATTFYNEKKQPSRDIITSEIIYYWMIAYNIPFECEKWHLNRLLTLITVCSKKNEKPKKMSKADLINRNREINNARRKKMNTNG